MKHGLIINISNLINIYKIDTNVYLNINVIIYCLNKCNLLYFRCIIYL